jgi:hypothetical protein
MAPLHAPCAPSAAQPRAAFARRDVVARGAAAGAHRAAAPLAAPPAQQLCARCPPQLRSRSGRSGAAPGSARSARTAAGAARGALRCVAAAGAAEDFYAVLGVDVTADGACLRPMRAAVLLCAPSATERPRVRSLVCVRLTLLLAPAPAAAQPRL